MNLEQVLKHFDAKPHELAKKMGVSRGAISQWKSAGIPEGRQWQIEALTKGKLKADQPEAA